MYSNIKKLDQDQSNGKNSQSKAKLNMAQRNSFSHNDTNHNQQQHDNTTPIPQVNKNSAQIPPKAPSDQSTKRKFYVNSKQQSSVRTKLYKSPGSHTMLQNPSKENDTNDIRLPKLDSINSPPPPKQNQKSGESNIVHKQRKSESEYRLSNSKSVKQFQGAHNISYNDHDTNTTGSSGAQSIIPLMKNPTPHNYGQKNYQIQKDDINENSQNGKDAIAQKNLIGSSPRYNIVKYKQNQQRQVPQQQDNRRMSDNPVQMIRPLNYSPNKQDSPVGSSSASDLAQLKRFEKKLKQVKDSSDGSTLQKDKISSDYFSLPKETNSNIPTEKHIIQYVQSPSLKNLNVAEKPPKPIKKETKFKYPVLNSLLKSKAGQYSSYIKKENQDAGLLQLCYMDNNYCNLSGVYDGHGESGAEVSNFVKKGISKYLMKEIKSQGGLENENIDFGGCLKRAYQQTNKDLLAQKEFDVSMSGCTAVTVLIYKNDVYCANTGDSRAMAAKYTQQEWRQIELSRDHKPEVPEEKARIVAHGGRVDQSFNEYGEKGGIYRVWKKNLDLPGLAMSRSMGDTVGRECGVICDPEIIKYTLTDDDKMIILASDGVWEFLSNQDVNKIFAPYFKDGKINEAIDKVMQISRKEWLKESESVDDITCIAFFITGFKETH